VVVIVISIIVSVLPLVRFRQLFLPELADAFLVDIGEDEVEDFVVPANWVASNTLLDVLKSLC